MLRYNEIVIMKNTIERVNLVSAEETDYIVRGAKAIVDRVKLAYIVLFIDVTTTYKYLSLHLS